MSTAQGEVDLSIHETDGDSDVSVIKESPSSVTLNSSRAMVKLGVKVNGKEDPLKDIVAAMEKLRAEQKYFMDAAMLLLKKARPVNVTSHKQFSISYHPVKIQPSDRNLSNLSQIASPDNDANVDTSEAGMTHITMMEEWNRANNQFLEKLERDIKNSNYHSYALSRLKVIEEQLKARDEDGKISIRKSVNTFYAEKQYKTLLNLAANHECPDREYNLIGEILNLFPDLVCQRERNNTACPTVLHRLVFNRNLRAVICVFETAEKKGELKNLLSAQVINEKYEETRLMGEIPLFIAALSFDNEMVDKLINKGAEVSTIVSGGNTVFHLLVKYAYLYPESLTDVQLMMIKLNNALQTKRKVNNASQNGENVNNALQNGENVNNALQNGENVNNALQNGENENNALQNGENVNNALQNGENVNNALQNGENVNNALQNGENVNNALQNGENVNNALQATIGLPNDVKVNKQNTKEISLWHTANDEGQTVLQSAALLGQHELFMWILHLKDIYLKYYKCDDLIDCMRFDVNDIDYVALNHFRISNPGNQRQGNSHPGSTVQGNSSTGNTGQENPSTGNTGQGNSSTGNTGQGNSSTGNTGQGNSSIGNTGQGNSSTGNTGQENSSTGQGNSRTGKTGQGNSSTGNTGQGNSSTGNTGQGNSSTGNTGQGNSSTGNTGQGNSNPRIRTNVITPVSANPEQAPSSTPQNISQSPKNLRPSSVTEIICEKIESEKALQFINIPLFDEIWKKKWVKYQIWFYWWLALHVVSMSFITAQAVIKAHLINANQQLLSTTQATIFVYIVSVLLFANGVLYIVLEFVSVHHRCMPRVLRVPRNGDYHGLLVVLSICLVVDAIWVWVQGPQNNYLLAIALIIGGWFCTFFLRPYKIFSVFTTIVRSALLGDGLRFAVIILFDFVAFSFAMYFLYLTTPGGPPAEFEHPGMSALTMFKLMIGVDDLEILTRAPSPWLTVTLFIIFVVLTYILMFNILTAIMTERTKEISEKGELQWKLQRLAVVVMIEKMLPLSWACNSAEVRDIITQRFLSRDFYFEKDVQCILQGRKKLLKDKNKGDNSELNTSGVPSETPSDANSHGTSPTTGANSANNMHAAPGGTDC